MGDWPAFIMCGLGLERMKHRSKILRGIGHESRDVTYYCRGRGRKIYLTKEV